jgi:MoaA/NifB/PqqE/SkfB family radical SAM enzyme
MRPIPRFLFLDINEVCNLRCTHCDYWRLPQPSLVSMRLPFMSQLIEEFSTLNPKGTVAIRGGEPTLEVGTFFELCRIIRKKGLRSITVTNGTTIATVEDAEQLVLHGPDEISLSLDSPA